MKIALVQMKVVDGDGQANLAHARDLIRAHSGADLYLLPEVWSTGYARNYWDDYIRNHHASIQQELQALADEKQAVLAGSMIDQNDAGQRVNRLSVFSPGRTQPLLHYDKVHLFSPLDEDKLLQAGQERVHALIADWDTGLSLCYDLRFPASYRMNAREGAALFLVPCQWPAERRPIMETLAAARAAENQAYVALTNRIGVADSGLAFGGGSGLWSPEGVLLTTADEREEVVDATLDPELIRKLRHDFPVLSEEVPGVDLC